MSNQSKFSPEVCEHAVRLVQEHRSEYLSLWATIESIAPKIGCVPATLLDWVKRSEIDSGTPDGMSLNERERMKALERENKELRRARSQGDEGLMAKIERVWQANMQVYGVRKVWLQLQREGIAVACCTVERLIRHLGLQGMRRGKRVRTTITDNALAETINWLYKAELIHRRAPWKTRAAVELVTLE